LTLLLRRNPGQRILPGILEEVVATMTDAGSAARDLLQVPLQRMREATGGWTGEPGDAEVASMSVAVRRTLERSGALLSPPVIQLRTEAADEGKKSRSEPFLLLFFPSMLGLAVLFLAQSLALDLVTDRAEGTVRRALSLGCRPVELLLGKALAGLVILALALVVMVVLGRLLLAIPGPRLLEAWVLAIAAGTAVLILLQWVALLPRVLLWLAARQAGRRLREG